MAATASVRLCSNFTTTVSTTTVCEVCDGFVDCEMCLTTRWWLWLILETTVFVSAWICSNCTIVRRWFWRLVCDDGDGDYGVRYLCWCCWSRMLFYVLGYVCCVLLFWVDILTASSSCDFWLGCVCVCVFSLWAQSMMPLPTLVIHVQWCFRCCPFYPLFT